MVGKDKQAVVSLLRKYVKQMPKPCRKDFAKAVEFYAGSSDTSYSCLASSSPVPFVSIWWGTDYMGRTFITLTSGHYSFYARYEGDFFVVSKYTRKGYMALFSQHCQDGLSYLPG